MLSFIGHFYVFVTQTVENNLVIFGSILVLLRWNFWIICGFLNKAKTLKKRNHV